MSGGFQSRAAAHGHIELIVAGIAIGLALALSLFTLMTGRIDPASFLTLQTAYLKIGIGGAIPLLIMMVAVPVIRVGLASSWRESPSAHLRALIVRRWREDRLIAFVWPPVAWALLLAGFNAFKQRVLPQAGFEYDAALANADRFIFFGQDPGIWMHRLADSAVLTGAMDSIYHGWFLPMSIGVMLIGALDDRRLRAQYMLAFMGVWIVLGVILAYAFPAAGPCFYQALVGGADATRFVPITDALQRHALALGAGMPLTSLDNQRMLLALFDKPQLGIGGGISAVPSVHNALAVLFALLAFRLHRIAGIIFAAFAVLIWIGSIYLGWHYAVDGILGALGAVTLWLASGRFAAWLWRDRAVVAIPAEAASAEAIA